MKIKKIQISNFRCYYGDNCLDLNTDGKVTIIYGLAGSGKSSLLNLINWVFYNKNDFLYDENNKITKPLYNIKKYDETSDNSTFVVKGIIDFVHEKQEYKIMRSCNYKKEFGSANEISREFTLLYSDGGNWKPYLEDIPNKINSIIPRALSKYFFFHGEKMDNLGADDSELKDSIYKLFGLNKYEAALKHIGDKKTHQTILNKYYSSMNSELSKKNSNNPDTLFSNMLYYNNLVTQSDEAIKKLEKSIENLGQKNNTLLDLIGKSKNNELVKDSLKKNNFLIKAYETQISNDYHDFGRCLYKTAPYLLLSNLTKNSIQLLTIEAEKQKNTQKTVFINLKKDLLKEILDKEVCVCGNKLTEEMASHIKDIIDSMPPDSYTYQLRQFAEKSSSYLNISIEQYNKIGDYFTNITKKINDIYELEQENKKITNDLKNQEETRDYASEYRENSEKIAKAKNESKKYTSAKEEFQRKANSYEKDYYSALKYVEIKKEYTHKIEILEELKEKIEYDKQIKEKQTRKILEESILEIYKKLSTRVEDDIQFLQENYGLRNGYFTGGQKVIDVYSYIIGMIKALHITTKDNENDFPIIIDAPFSHSDIIQSTKVFSTLPEIASQVIILTLELDKFKNAIEEKNVGNIYIIRSDEKQECATIKPYTIEELFDEVKKDEEKSKRGSK